MPPGRKPPEGKKNETPMIHLTQDEADAMLEKAALAGALSALKQLGLSDDNAADDMREFRTMLSSWRSVKRTAIETVIKALVTALMGALMAGLLIHYHFFGGSN